MDTEIINVWLRCFFDLFKLGLVMLALYIAFYLGYETRRKEEQRYGTRGVRRIARKGKKLRF